MNVLVLNPGGNSLKVEVVACSPDKPAYNANKLASVILEGIGKEPCLSVEEGKKVVRRQSLSAQDWKEAAASVFHWLETEKGITARNIDCVGLRVVHGGRRFVEATEVSTDVEEAIQSFERLAPLHNASSLALIGPARAALPGVPRVVVFDTAFHTTIPEVAARYAIPHSLAEKHGIRRFGFHGTSHRYLMHRAAHLLKRPVEHLKLITMHLESGCSAAAILQGKSVDTTMGFTPLEGLMMGTRSGDIDPSLIPFLMQNEHMQLEDVMTLLNKESGLLGVSEKSLDTRVLMKSYGQDTQVTLAVDMFAYRLGKAVGAYLSVLNGADAIVFGGGIGENNAVVRQRVCESLSWCGLRIDSGKNEATIDREGKLSTDSSSLSALVVVTEEGLQIAKECCDRLSRRAQLA